MFAFSVLGPVEAFRDGRPLPLPAGKTSELLVRLALEAGNVVSADRLVEDLWGAEAQGLPHSGVGAARNTLHAKVARLRKALGSPPVVLSVDGGYRLDLDTATVDALTVLAGVAQVTALVAGGQDEAAAELCASTRRLFRGQLLAGAGDGLWVAPYRSRLETAQLQLVEAECAARLRLGQHGLVVGELESATTAFPFQESLWALLITALYRAGRQTDALAAYQRVRALLAEETGLEPGPQLREVEAQVLAHDPALDPRLVAAAEPGDTPTAMRTDNLPTLVADLIGRADELAAVLDLVETSRLVEIVGPGGIGKTALAICAAHRLTASRRAWLVRLETTTCVDEILDAVIAATGVTGVEALVEQLRRHDTLIVLDNCEHVLDAVAEIVERLLGASPRTRLLCTTQAPLGIPDEAVVDLDPLGIDDAVALFVRRAETQRRQQTLDGADPALRDVCRSLDGLPLAIELAAARTRTLSLSEIGRRLDDRFDLLNDPTSRLPERRRALRATIGWSYDLLFPDDQRGLWALATFAGGATLPALEHILGSLDVPGRTGLDVVGRLAGRSLLVVDEGDGGTATRYRLLDSIRAFALDAMAAAGLSDAAHAAHAGWFAAAAARSTAGTRSAEQASHLAEARAERANIDAALNWSIRHDPLGAVVIANGFGWAWAVLGDGRGAQRILAALDAAGALVPAADRATGLLLAGWFEASIGDLETARTHIEQATGLADLLGDPELQARAASYLAYVVSHDGDFRSGLELTARSRALYAPLDRPWDLAANALFATRAAISAGDESLALAAADHTSDAIAAVDDPWLHVRYEAMLGELARLQHRFDDAVRHIERAAATSHRLGFVQTEAYQVCSLGRAQCQAGDYETGARTLRSAVNKASAAGDLRMTALARVHLGRVLRAVGDTAEARVVLEEAATWHRNAGGGEQAILGDTLLAALDAAEGQPGAPERLADLVEAARAADNAAAEVFALDALVRAAQSAGDHGHAADLNARAEARVPAALHFITQRDRVDALAAHG